MEAIGKKVPLSNQQRQMMRRQAFGITIWNGQPTIWVMINLYEIGSPLCTIVAGVHILINTLSALRKEIWRIAVTNNPVSSAWFFKILIDVFISHIVKVGSRDGGIFGLCDVYFEMIEVSKQGALHFYYLIWITGNVDIRKLQEYIISNDEFIVSVIKYIEDLMKQSLTAVDEVDVARPPLLEWKINSDSEQFEYNLKKDSNLIAKRFNMHKYISTCQKYWSGEQSYQFGAPWELVEESYKDEVGVVHMKRNELYINKWNDTITTTL